MSEQRDKIENYYEQQTYQTIEKAILAESVTTNGFKDVKGKFFLKVMTPSVETDAANVKIENGVQSSNYVELTIPGYLLLSFGTPKIEEIIHEPNDGEYDHKGVSGNRCVLTFSSSGITIPKDSEFLVEFMGGNLEIDSACVIAVYKVPGGAAN